MEEQRPTKRLRTLEEIKRRARRTAIRLASAANRSHWQSLVELSIILLTGGESLVTHQQYTLFMKQLVFMVQQCKRVKLGRRAAVPDDSTAPFDVVDFEVGSRNAATETVEVAEKPRSAPGDRCRNAGRCDRDNNDMSSDHA